MFKFNNGEIKNQYIFCNIFFTDTDSLAYEIETKRYTQLIRAVTCMEMGSRTLQQEEHTINIERHI